MTAAAAQLPAHAIFDGHNDTLGRLRHDGPGAEAGFLAGDGHGHLDLPRALAAGMRGGLFAAFAANPGPAPPPVPTDGGWAVPDWPPVGQSAALEETLAMAAVLHRVAAASGGRLEVVRDAGALERAMAAGRLAAVLHLEGAEAIDPDALDTLHVLHAAGLRSLGPVWSRPNAFGHGVPMRRPESPDCGPGLTGAGRRLVATCVELGIVVDLAHITAQGFWDVAGALDGARPLVVSHAGVHALAPTSRNLTGDQLDAIGASGGLVGIWYAANQLCADPAFGRDTPLVRVLEHVEHVAERIGVAHVALGSDFDGTTVPDAIGDVGGGARLLDALRERGWSEDDRRALAHGNWLRVLRGWWG